MRIQATSPNPPISDHSELRENTMTTHHIVEAKFAARDFGQNLHSRGSAAALRESPSKAGLLQGASIALAALFLAAPGIALADDECGAQVDSGNPESFNCSDPDYGSGVTYATDGDLTLIFNNAGSPARSNIGGAGINVTGSGMDGVTINSAGTDTELDSAGATGALVGVTTVNGDIDIDVEELDADFAPTTHGIFAESTGSGDIFIDTTGNVDTLSGTNPDTSIGIEAVTASGDIAITTGGNVDGNQYGIKVEAGGSGRLDIVLGGDIDIDDDTGITAIDATTGTGLLTIDIVSTGSFDTINGRGGNAIHANAGGDAVINIGEGRQVRSSLDSTAVLDLTVAGETAVNNAGSISGPSIQISGESLTINNDGSLGSSIDLSDLNGGYVFNNNAGATWNAGVFGGPQTSHLGTGILNNAGTIDIGGASSLDRIGSENNRVVSAPGSTFTGTGDSTLEALTFLNGVGQSDCANVKVTGCLDLQGGATAGQTSVLIQVRFTELVTGPLTAATSVNPGIVIVDVGGGSSQAGQFVLDPDSHTFIPSIGAGPGQTIPLYAEDPIYGAVLDTSRLGIGGGIFDYALLYNPDNQQHVLASVPQSQAIEYVGFIRQAASIWHTTTDAVVGRQAALRDGATGKLWARYVGDSTDYDASPLFTSHGNTFVYDQEYSFDTKALIIGLDLISGDDRAFGVHGGLVDTRAKFDETGTSDNSEGVTAGLYGAWWNESGLSLDATVNLNALTVDHTVSDDFESGDSDVRSLGARIEAGWRLPLMEETLYVQPLATAAYVTADFDDVDLRDNEVSFEGTESSRAGLGARLGGAVNLDHDMIGRLGYWLTARAWEEYADEGEARFATRDGSHLSIADDRSGSFEEVDLGFDISSRDGNLNVHFAAGMQFGDEIESSSRLSIGARLNW